jgi:hypothetical protein
MLGAHFMLFIPLPRHFIIASSRDAAPSAAAERDGRAARKKRGQAIFIVLERVDSARWLLACRGVWTSFGRAGGEKWLEGGNEGEMSGGERLSCTTTTFPFKRFWDYNEGKFPFVVVGLSKYRPVDDSGTSNVDVVRIFRTSTSPLILKATIGMLELFVGSRRCPIVKDLGGQLSVQERETEPAEASWGLRVLLRSVGARQGGAVRGQTLAEDWLREGWRADMMPWSPPSCEPPPRPTPLCRLRPRGGPITTGPSSLDISEGQHAGQRGRSHGRRRRPGWLAGCSLSPWAMMVLDDGGDEPRDGGGWPASRSAASKSGAGGPCRRGEKRRTRPPPSEDDCDGDGDGEADRGSGSEEDVSDVESDPGRKRARQARAGAARAGGDSSSGGRRLPAGVRGRGARAGQGGGLGSAGPRSGGASGPGHADEGRDERRRRGGGGRPPIGRRRRGRRV